MAEVVAEGGCLCGAVVSASWDRRPEHDFPPSYHAWVGDGPRWGRPADGLPAFERAEQT